VSEEGYVPYGWQFEDEQVVIKATKGQSVNCFGLFSRKNEFIYEIIEKNINADKIIEILDDFSLTIKKPIKFLLISANNFLRFGKKEDCIFSFYLLIRRISIL